MPAVIFIFICFITGLAIKFYFRIDTPALFASISKKSSLDSAHPPVWTFDIPFALITGTTLVTTIHYFISYISHFVFINTAINPLAVSNVITFSVFALFGGISLFKSIRSSGTVKNFAKENYNSISAYFGKTPRLYSVTLWGFTLFAIYLIFYSFFVKGSILNSGFTVFSDFAPHTAVISSFAYGNNFPTEYPHFAGDGIRYHFFFFYLCANLLSLGMRFDFAMNIPSIIGILSFTTLLGCLGVLITGRKKVFLMAPLLLFLRSSYAVFDYLSELYRKEGATLGGIIKDIFATNKFIGSTLHDDWGLWGLNVYANQRHLLWGLSILIIIIFMIYHTISKPKNSPANEQGDMTVNTGSSTASKPGDSTFSKPGFSNVLKGSAAIKEYLIGPGRWKIAKFMPLIPALMLALCLPYWHGSVMIAMLCILFVMALFAYERIIYILFAGVSVISSYLMSTLFSGGAQNVVSPSLLWGFLSDDKTFWGVFLYLLQVMGISLLLIVIIPFISSKREKTIFTIACISPIIFALTVSLTLDITVNHKYIIIAIALINIFIADLFFTIWHFVKRLYRESAAASVIAFILAIAVSFSLLSTGYIDLIGYKNKNRGTVPINLDSPLTAWIRENTDTSDVFLTAPYHLNEFFFSGRKVFFGWSYYTMSAGHDTRSRFQVVAEFFSGFDNNKVAFVEEARKNNIKYVIIDSTLLAAEDYSVNSDYFNENFEIVAEFPNISDTIIYKIYD